MRVFNLVVMALSAIVILIACGHSRKAPPGLPDSLSQPSTTSAADPQWLVDALAELDALQRPADVSPSLFADLKASLAPSRHPASSLA